MANLSKAKWRNRLYRSSRFGDSTSSRLKHRAPARFTWCLHIFGNVERITSFIVLTPFLNMRSCLMAFSTHTASSYWVIFMTKLFRLRCNLIVSLCNGPDMMDESVFAGRVSGIGKTDISGWIFFHWGKWLKRNWRYTAGRCAKNDRFGSMWLFGI